MKYNVKYRTKDHSLGYAMAVNGDTTFQQINNFTNGYSISILSRVLNRNVFDVIAEYDTAYIYLNKRNGTYKFVESFWYLPELEEMEENNEM